jgi:hypothetical protein
LLFLRVDKKEDGVNPKTNFCLRKKNIYRMLYREKLGNFIGARNWVREKQK